MPGKKCVCRKCGENLVIEYIAERGEIYRLKQNGEIGARIKSVKYEATGDYMVYCRSCGENYAGRLCAGRFEIWCEEEG